MGHGPDPRAVGSLFEPLSLGWAIPLEYIRVVDVGRRRGGVWLPACYRDGTG